MKQHVDRGSRWLYSGIWAVLVRWFRVPDQPPTIPGGTADVAHSFRPAEGFLRYLKFYFWIALVLIDGLILIGWIVVTVAWPWVGILLALPASGLRKYQQRVPAEKSLQPKEHFRLEVGRAQFVRRFGPRNEIERLRQRR